MKRNKFLTAILFCLLVLFTACQQGTTVEEDTVPPAPVTDVQIIVEEGKVILTWADSPDEDFIGVRVSLGILENEEATFNPFQKGVVVLKGTQKYEISDLRGDNVFKLIAIDNSFNESEPVISEKIIYKAKEKIITEYLCPTCKMKYDTAEKAANCHKGKNEKPEEERIITEGTYNIIHKQQSSVFSSDYKIYETEENKKIASGTMLKNLIKTYSGFTFASFSYNKDTVVIHYNRNTIEQSFVKINQASVTTPISIPGSSFYYASNMLPVVIDDFYIAKNEVTYAKWQEVYNWATAKGYTFDNPGQKGGGAEHVASNNEPVTGVNFRDAIVWCNAASEMDGLNSVYYYEYEGQEKTVKSTEEVSAAKQNSVANGYRLPTEAEWEFAARGADVNAECWNYNYAGSNDIGSIAWYTGNSDAHTHEVGKKPANAAGLYDMTGNVWEWTWWPLDASLVGNYRFLRGGYWGDPAENSYIIMRSMLDYTAQGPVAGFRVARSVVK